MQSQVQFLLSKKLEAENKQILTHRRTATTKTKKKRKRLGSVIG